MIIIYIIVPIIGLLINIYISSLRHIKTINIIISLLLLYISIYQYITFNFNSMEYQWRYSIGEGIKIIRYTMGIDGINISLIILLNILFPLLFWIVEEDININKKLYICYIVLIFIFLSLDIIIFFIFFEVILIPMFIFIGVYGSKGKRIEASYRLLLYTYMGSLFMLISILYLYIINGSSNLEYIIYNIDSIPLKAYRNIWILITLSLLIKLPVFPFHIWLPIVHVESPTIASILLAGILLKIATYGIIRFSLPIFSYLNTYYSVFIYIIVLLSIYYAALINIRQIDLKKIIAYSSIVHMNFALFGLFSNDINGLYGSLFSNISHGIVSSALFYLVGILYIRYHNRIITYYKGLINIMPLFSIFFFFFILHNIAIPLSSSFISEIYIIISSYKVNYIFSLLLTFSLLLSTIYNIWLISRILFSMPNNINFSLDLSKNEFISLSIFLFLSFFIGIYPSSILSLFTPYLLPLLF